MQRQCMVRYTNDRKNAKSSFQCLASPFELGAFAFGSGSKSVILSKRTLLKLANESGYSFEAAKSYC
jgi:hypothetical protein